MPRIPRVLRVAALVVCAASRVEAQNSAAQPSRETALAASREIVRDARYATLVTIGSDGQPQARIVDPFVPDSDYTIWIATNPVTRKVEDIRRDARVTLLYFNAAKSEYVTVIGSARVDTDSLDKARHWKGEWAGLYMSENRGGDYMLLRITPSRLEISSVARGLRNDARTWRPIIIDMGH
jgi:general stress protein 26